MFSRYSWAVLQFDLVPQSYPRSPLHTCDWLRQWPMYSAMGPEKTVHSGPVCRCAAGSGAVFKWIINRWDISEWSSPLTNSNSNNYCLTQSVFCCLLSGLSIGDSPGRQPIGIVLTVVGVVVLDFCADASEGPIRAYLLDVADTEEQDMALNIHAFSAGKAHRPQRLSLCLGKYLYIVHMCTNKF